MANEELSQRGYLVEGELKGDTFGSYEMFDIGSTSVQELRRRGLQFIPPESVKFPFQHYKATNNPLLAQPDKLIAVRHDGKLSPVAIAEHKRTAKFKTSKDLTYAAEQALFSAVSTGVSVAIISDAKQSRYLDVTESLKQQQLVFLDENRDFNSSVLTNILKGDAGVVKDPAPLAEAVWQMIWHATKEEPKQCLLTFVEIFVLKFLSDNLPLSKFGGAYRFDALLVDPKEFHEQHGKTAIEYYISTIRPKIKSLFPDNVIAEDQAIGEFLTSRRSSPKHRSSMALHSCGHRRSLWQGSIEHSWTSSRRSTISARSRPSIRNSNCAYTRPSCVAARASNDWDSSSRLGM